jgi:hypothetical protein
MSATTAVDFFFLSFREYRVVSSRHLQQACPEEIDDVETS